ncbi:hypothetical protein MVEN_00093600 [Mycena venus]|uniref:Uncharacterized protein n=1 Tax=Mycena venus TaxID=2733690 RepID=A0A8H6Z832_9AGAR|nr:hypothetical protein MVEN_00093600 [Mycena venus]
MGVSGWKWHPERGADIDPTTKDSWDAWVKNNLDGKRFCNKGWVHYNDLIPLMPEKAKGSHAFRGTAALSRKEKSPSPDWDEEELEKGFAATNNDEGVVGSDGDVGHEGAGRNEDEDDDQEDEASGCPRPTIGSARPPHSLQDMRELFASASGSVASTSTVPAAAPAVVPTVPPTPVFQTSPQRLISAVTLAQQEDWMTVPERLALIRILKEDPRMVDVYSAMLTEDMRIPWIIDELGKVGVVVFHHKYSMGPLSGIF